ncbi:lipid II:glycine glycyltransferase FemX [Gleimia hominis]|uniref:lipid II:glycine glycyltransferase FemX n=1 Tax=Gleimia hominis TaxID=595468 RepID=UPI000C7FC73D|nr:GNAT family N-acetyltransferase [Gleimia hominis]WIK65127.1 GNAT family N-acetyltransferase [Gleimia hominis]
MSEALLETKLEQISGETLAKIAREEGLTLPIEQTEHWDRFDRVYDRENFGKYAFYVDNRCAALMSFTVFELRGVRFLWAKRGPVWLRRQSPDIERTLRKALIAETRKRDKTIVFIRLHARYSSKDTYDLVQSVPYDHTVKMKTMGGQWDQIMGELTASARKRFRRAIRKMRATPAARTVDLTQCTQAKFKEVYDVLVETANRDGFGVHPPHVYWNMLRTLGSKHARLYGIEIEGRVAAWTLVVMNGDCAWAYYGAHSAAARKISAAEYLDLWIGHQLGKEGYVTFDLMGVDSMRVPELFTVGQYKRRFARHETEVDGAWEVPVNTPVYLALRAAARAKRALVSIRN